jgi:hypothetical protein
MTSGAPVCPACGVAIVPGYVRCPKCHAALPAVRFRASIHSIDPGGTAMRTPSRFPLVPALIAVVVGGALIAYFALHHGGKASAPPTEPAVPDKPIGAAVVGAPGVAPVTPEPVESTPATPAPPGPDAKVLAADLDRSLKHQRLWSTVEVIGRRVDVRSGSCSEAAMTTALDRATRAFKTAGLTKLRCLEQSGRVVIDRDL